MSEVSDEQLLAFSQNGDRQAFAKLMRRYQTELYNFLLRFVGQSALAEDIFQETFLQVHISAKDFDTSRRFKPWLYTIAANKARDMLRNKARKPAMQLTDSSNETSEVDLWHNLLSDEITPFDILDKKQQHELVRDTVQQLPDHLREILILAYFNHLSYKEMSEVLDIPLGTVKSRLHAAVGAFAKKFKEISQEP